MPTIRISWNPNPSAELVSEYRVSESFNLGAFEQKYVTSDTHVDIVDPPQGAYAWRIKAVNIAGVSPDSNTLGGPNPPTAPTGLAMTVL